MMESDNPYLNKILKVMDDNTNESAVQALELAASFGLEDEVLKRIPPRSSGKMSLNGLAGKVYTPTEIIVKLYNEAMDVLSGKPPVYSTGLKLPSDKWIFEGYLLQIAYNKNTPKELLMKLAKYDNVSTTLLPSSIRYHVASNERAPKEILMILANDEDEDVREKARKKLGDNTMKESRFKLSTEDIRKMIKEELKKL